MCKIYFQKKLYRRISISNSSDCHSSFHQFAFCIITQFSFPLSSCSHTSILASIYLSSIPTNNVLLSTFKFLSWLSGAFETLLQASTISYFENYYLKSLEQFFCDPTSILQALNDGLSSLFRIRNCFFLYIRKNFHIISFLYFFLRPLFCLPIFSSHISMI